MGADFNITQWIINNSYGRFYLCEYTDPDVCIGFELYDSEHDTSFYGLSSNECLAKMVQYYD